MRFIYNILSRDYGLIPYYKREVRERNFIINTSILMMLLLILFIIIYMVYFSDDLDIKLLIS